MVWMSRRVLQFVDCMGTDTHISHINISIFGARCTCVDEFNWTVPMDVCVCAILRIVVCIQCLYKKLPQKYVLVTHGNTTVHFKKPTCRVSHEYTHMLGMNMYIKGKFIRLTCCCWRRYCRRRRRLIPFCQICCFFRILALISPLYVRACVCCICSYYSYTIHQCFACIRRFNSGKRIHINTMNIEYA